MIVYYSLDMSLFKQDNILMLKSENFSFLILDISLPLLDIFDDLCELIALIHRV